MDCTSTVGAIVANNVCLFFTLFKLEMICYICQAWFANGHNVQIQYIGALALSELKAKTRVLT